MAEQAYRPGEPVPHSGVYRVVHQGHRPDHESTLFKGQNFPTCARCGDGVRFCLVRAADSIKQDRDFENSAS